MQNTPVTLDMIRDEKRWHEELARELSGVLQGTGGKGGATGIMGERGIIGLDEVWGSWNRARGIGTANFIHLHTYDRSALTLLESYRTGTSLFGNITLHT